MLVVDFWEGTMDKFKQIIDQLLESFKKGSIQLKFGIIAGALVLLVAIVFTSTYSSSPAESLLFQRPLTIGEYGAITAELDKLGIEYNTRSDKYILLKDEETGKNIRMKLAQTGKMPNSIKGWDLFDMESWTSTEFERDVKLRRAIQGQMTRHLESLSWVEQAVISIDMPEDTIYTAKEKPVQASITITPSFGEREILKDKKVIKGIENIVAGGVDGLETSEITITDDRGRILNDFAPGDLEDQLIKIIEENKITERQRQSIEQNVIRSIHGILPEDRYRVSVDLELKFDKIEEKIREILPMTIKKRTPGLPYDDSKVIEKTPISSKKIKEDFKGQGFIPEGPPGQEPNIPPGYKELIERFNEYNKTEDIVNYDHGEQIRTIIEDAQEIMKKSVSVVVDGTWKRELDEGGKPIFEGEGLKRTYIPYPREDIIKLEESIKASIGYNAGRRDKVVVRNIMFDRSAQFQDEDLEYVRSQRIQQVVFLSLISLIGITIAVIVIQSIRREISRRRRLREQELQRQRQLQREQALQALKEDQLESISEEDMKRHELQERADQLSAERPGDVAKLIRSWLADDNSYS